MMSTLLDRRHVGVDVAEVRHQADDVGLVDRQLNQGNRDTRVSHFFLMIS